MATIQSSSSPWKRVEIGDAVIESGRATNTGAVKKRFAEFEKQHRAYSAAAAVVARAEERVGKQQALIGECDVLQDDAALRLASALAGDGLPRLNPFKPLGFPAPSALIKVGYEKEAVQLVRLARAAASKKGASAATRAAARDVERAAEKLLAAQKPLAEIQRAYRDAITRRDALAQGWETAFAALKRGVRAAEDDGARGLFAALFERKARPSVPRRAPAIEAAPPTPPPSPTPPAPATLTPPSASPTSQKNP